MTFAVADHWYAFFVALDADHLGPPHGGCHVARSPGRIHSSAWVSPSSDSSSSASVSATWVTWHNDTRFRALILLLLFSVQLNDIFAYIVGKSLGGPKLAPRTSPNKTISELARCRRADHLARRIC